jgi:hypothetical protein
MLDQLVRAWPSRGNSATPIDGVTEIDWPSTSSGRRHRQQLARPLAHGGFVGVVAAAAR